jgi:hypothetical protein
MWGDILGSIIKGVAGVGDGESVEVMGVPLWGGSEGGANERPLPANATVDRVLAGHRTELNINDQ